MAEKENGDPNVLQQLAPFEMLPFFSSTWLGSTRGELQSCQSKAELMLQ